MSLVNMRQAAAGICLLASFGSAHGQSIQSQLGPQARATISITVSVLPSFKVTNVAGAPSITSNAPSQLRYGLVTQPLQDSGPTSIAAGYRTKASANHDRLVLVVPD